MPGFIYNHPKTNFSAGVLSSTMLARYDVKAYDAGLLRGLNCALLVHGGLKRRPGTDWLANLGEETRLIEFVYSRSQRYILALQNLKLKVYSIAGVLLDTEVASWTASTMWQVRYVQKFDTAFFADGNGNYMMHKLVRTGAATFVMSTYAFETAADGKKYTPFYKFADPAITLTPGATAIGAGASMTLSAPGYWINAAAPAGHVGVQIRYMGKQITITAVGSATVATGTIREVLPGLTASADWEEEIYSGLYGYPTAVGMHSQRLWLAGPRELPAFIWGSKAAAFFNFDDGTALPGEAIGYVLLFDGVSKILHICSGPHLQVFTDGGMGYAPEGLTTPLTPADFDIRMRTPYAIGDVRPLVFDVSTLYVHDEGRSVRDAYWSEADGGYVDEDASLLSSDLVKTPVDISVAYGIEDRPEQYGFFVNTDGTLLVYLGLRQEKVRGWAPWESQGLYKSTCVAGENAFFVVYRTFNGVASWHLEKLNWDALLDCSIELTSGAATMTFAGAAHLASTTQRVVGEHYYAGPPEVRADNCYDHGDFAVSAAGAVTITYACKKIRVGLAFYPIVEPLPVEINTADFGSTAGMMRRNIMVTLRLETTRNVRINGQRLKVMRTNQDFSLAPPSLNGKVRKVTLGWGRDENKVTTIIDQDLNLPFALLFLLRKVVL